MGPASAGHRHPNPRRRKCGDFIVLLILILAATLDPQQSASKHERNNFHLSSLAGIAAVASLCPHPQPHNLYQNGLIITKGEQSGPSTVVVWGTVGADERGFRRPHAKVEVESTRRLETKERAAGEFTLVHILQVADHRAIVEVAPVTVCL